MRKTAHITVGGEPFCNWLGTQAGLDVQQRVVRANSNLELADVCCGHRSISGANRIAAALRPNFRAGAVAVVVGSCPQLPAT